MPDLAVFGGFCLPPWPHFGLLTPEVSLFSQNCRKNSFQNPEFNIVVQFSTFYVFAFCFRISPLVLFCTIGFVSHYQFVQFKIFGVHQLQPQTHLVLLLYFDSTAELHNSLSILRSNRCSSTAASSAYNTQLDEVCLLQLMNCKIELTNLKKED